MFGEIVADNPSTMTEDEILEIYTHKLQENIIEQPEVWLWSHRRWKLKKPVEA